mgnify:CR=1 FL=1
MFFAIFMEHGGEVVDNLSNQRISQINNYREKTGYQIDTGNVIY